MTDVAQTARVRFDWGPVGALASGGDADVVVVVDTLVFTTTVTVAVERGIEVLPFRWSDRGQAEDFAAEHDAAAAVSRSAAGAGRVSLSPVSVRAVDPAPARLVLPSPNGSTVAAVVGDAGRICLAGCLRNATAIGDWITARVDPAAAVVTVVAAGERWPDGSLRPAVEDLWGAGAVLAALRRRGFGDLSPEARVAVAAHADIADDAAAALAACVSGRELSARGYADDVHIAAEVDAATVVPRLVDGTFRPA